MSQYLGILTGVFAISGIAAVAWAGLQRGDRQNLRESLADATGRVDFLSKARADAEEQAAKEKARADRAEADLVTLGKVVTGEAHLVALGDKLEDHHVEAKQYWAADAETNRQILEVLRRLSEGMR